MAARAISLLIAGIVTGAFHAVFGGAFTGLSDRESLREDINNLFRDRRDVYLSMLRIRVLSSNVEKLMDELRQVDLAGVGKTATRKLQIAITQYKEIT